MSGRRARKRTHSGNIVAESPKERLDLSIPHKDTLSGLLCDNNFLEYLQNERLLSPFECFFIANSPDKTTELFKILLEKQNQQVVDRLISILDTQKNNSSL